MKKEKEIKGMAWNAGERVTSVELARLDSEYRTLAGYLRAVAESTHADVEAAVKAVEAIRDAGNVSYTFNERVKGSGVSTVSAKMTYRAATSKAAECLELKRNCSKLIIDLVDTSKAVAVKGHVVSTLDKLDEADAAYVKRDKANFTTWLNDRRIGEQVISTYVDRLVKKYQIAINSLRTSLELMEALPVIDGYQITVVKADKTAA